LFSHGGGAGVYPNQSQHASRRRFNHDQESMHPSHRRFSPRLDIVCAACRGGAADKTRLFQ
jgi:hypothetical protein